MVAAAQRQSPFERLSKIWRGEASERAALLKAEAPSAANQETDGARHLLAAKINSLDERALLRLGPHTRDFAEVQSLLEGAAKVGVEGNHVKEGKQLFEQARQAYATRLRTKNRTMYLVGVVLGGFLAAGIANLLLYIWAGFFQFYLSWHLIVLVLLFGGIGSLTSLLSRLSTTDLSHEVSNLTIVTSAAFKPIVAMFFALVVAFVLNAKLIDIKFGENPSRDQLDQVILVAAFLSGFSERFAKDLIARVPFTAESSKTTIDQADDHGAVLE